MKSIKWVVLAAIPALFVGCASPSKVVTADLKFQFGTNVVTVTQPKDTIIESLDFDPKTGKLNLRGYSSTANAAAIAAAKEQAAAQAASFQFAVAAFQALANRAADWQGIPKGYKLVPDDSPPDADPLP